MQLCIVKTIIFICVHMRLWCMSVIGGLKVSVWYTFWWVRCCFVWGCWCFDNAVIFMHFVFSIHEWKGSFQIEHREGIQDNSHSLCRLCQPWYMDPQQSVHPHIVRPSAQYPAGVRLCVPSNACSQSFRETSNGQGFFPGIPQHSCNLTESHPRWDGTAIQLL